jgi:hypothetical protein
MAVALKQITRLNFQAADLDGGASSVLIEGNPMAKKSSFIGKSTGNEAARVLQAHQAQLLLAAGNPETEAAPVWRKVS